MKIYIGTSGGHVLYLGANVFLRGALVEDSAQSKLSFLFEIAGRKYSVSYADKYAHFEALRHELQQKVANLYFKGVLEAGGE